VNEDPGERARTYLAAIERALKLAEVVSNPDALRVVDYAKRYVADSKYYLETGKPTTALASVAYAEGLLDSLSIMGVADLRKTNSLKSVRSPRPDK
jgi:FAD synthetase